ncbi:MAG: hypothetical protein ACR2HR_02595 [Euzebya sp.]
MTRPSRPRFTTQAAADVHAIAQVDRDLANMALHLAIDLHEGRRDHTPLNDRVKTGDLSDCYKATFGHDTRRPSHRLVYRLVDGDMEVVEVVAAGPREDDVAYLMAGLRLGRINDPYRRSLAQRIIHRALGRGGMD